MTVELNARQAGPAESGRLPLIVLHGLFGSLDNLGGIIRRLEDRWQIHALDQRNHGQSPHTDTMDYPAMAADVLAYMDKQGLERACVLGHSMGGKVAMQLALLAPDRVDRVIVADISPVAYTPRHDAILEGLKAMDLSAVSSRTEADRQMANFVADAGVRQFLLKNLERIPKDQAIEGGPVFRWLLNLATIERCYSQLTDAPQGEGPFEGPVLFVKGADSAYLQSKHKDIILQLFPNASVKVIEGTGHWLHAEKPDTFATLCVDFLATDD